MALVPLVLLVVGLVLLVAGAEWLVRGGARLAGAMGVTPLVIGLTVVAFGTSSPELVVGFVGVFSGADAVTMGNVLGSNLFNILGVLGPAAIVAPLAVHAAVVRREIPVMLAATLLLALFALDGRIGRVEGLVLTAALVVYLVSTYRSARREPASTAAEYADEVPAPEPARRGRDVALVLAGVALLALGGRLAVLGAVDLAHSVGISERVVALTVIAAGTSLPELATSLVAARRGHADIAIGNVVGSNIFNVLFVVGVVALASPIDVPAASLRLDLPLVLIVSAALLPLAMTGSRVSRREGAALVAVYALYAAALLGAVPLPGG